MRYGLVANVASAEAYQPCRRKLGCEYNDAKASPHTRFEWSSRLVNGLPSPQQIDLPTILFLDPGLLKHGQLDTSRLAPPIPHEILQFLGDMDEVRATAESYFRHIHPWMPFICKKRFCDMYLQPSYHSRPDVVLLLLALKLITTCPPALPKSPRIALYHAAKHFWAEAEGSFSILVLQAGVLVALYELGHGLYPAAYVSIGTCARYAYALGINVVRVMPAGKVLSYVELEEKKRVWWAIIILDR